MEAKVRKNMVFWRRLKWPSMARVYRCPEVMLEREEALTVRDGYAITENSHLIRKATGSQKRF